MGNFKVRVNSQAESKEAQELLFELDYRWIDIGATYYKTSPNFNYLTAYFKGKTLAQGHGFDAEKEITLPDLRAMVNPMKEFLNKKTDGSYELIVSNGGCVDGDWTEVPEGMNYAYSEGSFIQFTKQEMGYRDSVLVWQRTSSLNDQYAEIEQVRQDNVNNPQHYNKGGVECIDAIEASMTPEAFKGYLKGNVQKYMWRYEQKGGVESLRKAQWYLERLVVSMDS